MKALILALVLLAALFPQEPKPNPLTVEYDRFTDRTSISVNITLETGFKDLGDGSVYASPDAKFDIVMFSVVGIVKGEHASGNLMLAPAIIVTSRSKGWVFLKSGTTLRVILDSKERLLVGEMIRSPGDVLTTGRVTEQLRLQVPFSAIERLSKASKIEMQIGLEEFGLTANQIDDLKLWVRQFPSAQSKSKPKP
jgi:hypothetical protein